MSDLTLIHSFTGITKSNNSRLIKLDLFTSLFRYFCLFDKLPKAGFELRTSGVGGGCSTNCASATASIRVFFHRTQLLYLICPPANGRGSLHSDETLKRKNAQTLQVQCDQIGWFLNVLNNRFSYRSNPNIYEFLGSLCKQPLLSKMCFGWLLSNFWKFCPTLGHTECLRHFLTNCVCAFS